MSVRKEKSPGKQPMASETCPPKLKTFTTLSSPMTTFGPPSNPNTLSRCGGDGGGKR
ncbi:hypothetical protein HanRHA438_Chr14g0646211 [Helianthus annuus]|nr:hypothetical protein HanRHA438_Chr14g0646211 [Helianthus annuus]